MRHLPCIILTWTCFFLSFFFWFAFSNIYMIIESWRKNRNVWINSCRNVSVSLSPYLFRSLCACVCAPVHGVKTLRRRTISLHTNHLITTGHGLNREMRDWVVCALCVFVLDEMRWAEMSWDENQIQRSTTLSMTILSIDRQNWVMRKKNTLVAWGWLESSRYVDQTKTMTLPME